MSVHNFFSCGLEVLSDLSLTEKKGSEDASSVRSVMSHPYSSQSTLPMTDSLDSEGWSAIDSVLDSIEDLKDEVNRCIGRTDNPQDIHSLNGTELLVCTYRSTARLGRLSVITDSLTSLDDQFRDLRDEMRRIRDEVCHFFVFKIFFSMVTM